MDLCWSIVLRLVIVISATLLVKQSICLVIEDSRLKLVLISYSAPRRSLRRKVA